MDWIDEEPDDLPGSPLYKVLIMRDPLALGDALHEVPCPFCHVKVGVPCRVPYQEAPRDKPHQQRIRRYFKEKGL